MLRYGSVFAGIGGFDSALDDSGFTCAWQVENDPACNLVLARYWPAVRRYGDVEEVDPAGLGPVDLVCGGSPCQDWSVAGKRAGLSGSRGRLFHEFIRVADAVAPRWLLFENVPGLLSSFGGEDFAEVLAAITGFRPAPPPGGWRSAGVCSGPKRHACWRVLDARFFGVPQRRKRVFLVASTPDAGCVEVLFEPESREGNSAPGREAGAGLAPALTPGAPGASSARAGEQLTVGAVNADPSRKGWASDDEFLVAGPVMAHSGIHERQQTFISHTLRPEGCDASEDGTGRGTPLVVQEDKQNGVTLRDTAGSLRANAPGHQPCGSLVMQEPTVFNWQAGGSKDFVGARQGHTDALSTKQTPAVVFQCHGNNVGPMGTVRSGNGELTGGVPFVAEPVPLDMRQASRGGTMTNNRREGVSSGGAPGTGVGLPGDPAPSLAGTHTPAIGVGMVVRRLTPTECLRLMGQPDDYLDLDPPLSDGVKYRLIGNSVVRPVAAWVGRRIATTT